MTLIDVSGVAPLASISSANGTEPTAVTRSSSANDSNPFDSPSSPLIVFVVSLLTVVRATAIWLNGGPMLFNRLVASAADVNGCEIEIVSPPSGVAVGPSTIQPGGDHVVERQLVGDRRHGTDDVGIGGRHHRDRAGAVVGHRHVDRHVDLARREHERARTHGQQSADHGRHYDRAAVTGVARTRRREHVAGAAPADIVAIRRVRAAGVPRRPAASGSRWRWWPARPTTAARSPRRR